MINKLLSASRLPSAPDRRAGSRPVRAATMAVALVLTTAGLAACAPGADRLGQDVDGTTARPSSTGATGSVRAISVPPFVYKGAVVQQYTVPANTTTLTLAASGGAGGHASQWQSNVATGAYVTGQIAVQPGQKLLISVAGAGGSAGSNDDNPQGGWGGLGAVGGNGDASSDHLRTSGAGGGATTIQLADTNGQNAQTILIAGGAGGNGGLSGNQFNLGKGGFGGCIYDGGDDVSSWTGENGGEGTTHHEPGGTAAGMAGPAGGPGLGGHQAGGNGGGGGGGVNGGNAGTGAGGTNSAGGGGAGSSATYNMTNASVTCANAVGSWPTGNGQVTVTPSSI